MVSAHHSAQIAVSQCTLREPFQEPVFLNCEHISATPVESEWQRRNTPLRAERPNLLKIVRSATASKLRRRANAEQRSCVPNATAKEQVPVTDLIRTGYPRSCARWLKRPHYVDLSGPLSLLVGKYSPARMSAVGTLHVDSAQSLRLPQLGLKLTYPGYRADAVEQIKLWQKLHRRGSLVGWLIARATISPTRRQTRKSSMSWLYPTTRDVNKFSAISSLISSSPPAEKLRSGLLGKRGTRHRHFCPPRE